jgi:hypothetical protein
VSATKRTGAGRRRNEGGDYEVGYGKPPVKNRFKAGVSGNSRGRPKKAKPDDENAIPVIEDAVEILNETIEITEQGRKKKVLFRKVILRQYIRLVAKSNNLKALGDLIKLMEKWDRAVLEGRGQELLKIIVEGGLPTDDQLPPCVGDGDHKHPQTAACGRA